jgi:tRNA(Ile)-lysidine synthase
MLKLDLHNELNFLRKYSTIFVACSGGVDSVVLTHWLVEHNLPIHVLHCNFNLRGLESNKDEAFVQQFCENHNIPLSVKSFETEKEAERLRATIQETARMLRYNWFDEYFNATPNSIVCTAHHQDDNREELVLKLMSSGRLIDLTGIPQHRKGYYRPFLSTEKEAILNFAIQNNLKWREDSSNASNNYARNKVRNELLPLMHEIDTRVYAGIDRTLNEVGKLIMDINVQIDVFLERQHNSSEFLLPIDEWDNHLSIFKELLMTRMGYSLPLHEIERILSNSAIGSAIFDGNRYFLKESNGIWFGDAANDKLPESIILHKLLKKPIESSLGKFYLFEDAITDDNTISIALDSSKLINFSIRNVIQGEYLPFKHHTSRPLKKILNDLRLPHYMRRKQLVLTFDDQPVLLIERNEVNRWNKLQENQDTEKIFLKILV